MHLENFEGFVGREAGKIFFHLKTKNAGFCETIIARSHKSLDGIDEIELRLMESATTDYENLTAITKRRYKSLSSILRRPSHVHFLPRFFELLGMADAAQFSQIVLNDTLGAAFIGVVVSGW
ncbi:uncharacterized protein LACBIDRAFT_334017 [Laccaria bicolor S238N-H82]|uniref:Predicted protein n=1 Tax=Laccaria bicolor (strain S238N-H82 / ATCC MYA-4686) TaxID=486041 RepID=B0DXT8_LACBS|nr:uncharacterized protein LACBIDRAFT_334017 [Laccaria bicolor S238N-H82]EDR00570.1 predicted protein [Laccaria bicolor S238N-H82]|eukprot:XP_001888797.1 predicted protein [Laccaria bicolor S238N-H82]